VTEKDSVNKQPVINSYLFEHELDEDSLLKIAQALTNPITETFSINKSPQIKNFKYIIEIGFKPGVTDNVSHTVKETVVDLLHLNSDAKFAVYSSRIFLVKDGNKKNVEAYASSLYNPLIETSYIVTVEDFNKNGLSQRAPRVILEEGTPVIKVSLDVSDEELTAIGKEGILGEDGKRRGPLALDLLSMQTIQAYFKALKRDPTDIELESLAQPGPSTATHDIR